MASLPNNVFGYFFSVLSQVQNLRPLTFIVIRLSILSALSLPLLLLDCSVIHQAVCQCNSLFAFLLVKIPDNYVCLSRSSVNSEKKTTVNNSVSYTFVTLSEK